MDLLKITKNEGQAWLALYYLICSAQVRPLTPRADD
jgi:hypothetical protein